MLKEEGDALKYSLIHAKANRSIWFSVWRDEVPHEPVEIMVTQVSRPLDKRRAERICTLWSRMLAKSRYSLGERGAPQAEAPQARGEQDVEPSDHYEFRYHSFQMFGECWGTIQGTPKALIQVGKSMIACCNVPESEFEKSLATLDRKCDELEKMLDAQDKAEGSRTIRAEEKE